VATCERDCVTSAQCGSGGAWSPDLAASFTVRALLADQAASTSAPPSAGIPVLDITPAPTSGPSFFDRHLRSKPQALLDQPATSDPLGHLRVPRLKPARIERAEPVLRKPKPTALRCALSSGRPIASSVLCSPRPLSSRRAAALRIIAVWPLNVISEVRGARQRRGVANHRELSACFDRPACGRSLARGVAP